MSRTIVSLFLGALFVFLTEPQARADNSIVNSNVPLRPPLQESNVGTGVVGSAGDNQLEFSPDKLVNAEQKRSAANYSRLKDAAKVNNKSNPYRKELHVQSSPISLSASPINSVLPDPNAGSDADETSTITLMRPPLQALVSIDRALNPYGLESQYSQELGLRDALLATSEGNLDILRSVSLLEAQKWRVNNAYSGYLPNISFGFNELGLDSISQIPIMAIANASTAGLASSSGSATSTTTSSAGAASSGSIQTEATTTETILKTPLTVVNGGFNWKPIQGGRLIFTLLAQKHQFKANKAKLRADLSDALLTCTKDYYNLVLDDTLLQIRTSSVATSKEQLRQNTSLKGGGLATNLDVLQAKTQLSKDRQDLVNQQRARRKSALELAHFLNANLSQDLVPNDKTLRKVRLIPSSASITELLQKAIDNRPELKQYEELRQVAKKNIGVATSDLLPSVSLGGNVIGIASNIGEMKPTYLINFGVNWKLDGLGTTAATNIQTRRWQARQSFLEANQKFIDIFQQVRNAYDESFTAESAIRETSAAVSSATEELRLARLRLLTGLGTNVDVLTGQRDLTQAKIDKAQAIVNFNIAQAQLVHDVGLATVDGISKGVQALFRQSR